MLSSLPPPALAVNLHACTGAHAHTHKHFQERSPLPWRRENTLPIPPPADHLPEEATAEGPRGLASCGWGQVAKGVAGSDGRGGGRVPSLALNGQVPGPKPQVRQREFLSSFSTRFIICLLRPALWENRPSRRQHQALRVKAGMGAQ